jgi:hypothetical protein
MLFLALIEALVWLSIPAMSLLAYASPRLAEVPVPVDVVAEPLPIEAPAVAPVKLRTGTAAYYRFRIERDHPALAERIASGELSVHAASIAAGLRKPRAKSKWTSIAAYDAPELALAGAHH